MTEFTVSPALLRAKAQLLRKLLDERKATHQNVWEQLSSVAGMLPSDLSSSHAHANVPWNSAIQTLYDNYYELAVCMEAAADAYEQEEKHIQISLTPTN